MPTLLSQLDAAFRAAIAAAFDGLEADPQISVAQNEKFGDYQANAAMGLAKLVSEKTGQKTNPRAVAEKIVERLKSGGSLGDIAAEITIAGPGFINVRLAPAFLADRLGRATAGSRLGVDVKQSPQTVVIDYSGPNVAKEMHVGHLRSTIIGDAISRVLEFQGDKVIRQNHIGDWGTQFGMLIAYLERAGSGVGDGDDWAHGSGSARGAGDGSGSDTEAPQIQDLEQFYRDAKKTFDTDPAFADESRKTVVRLQGGDPEVLKLWGAIVEQTRRHYQPLYQRLGVQLKRTDERGESAYNAMLPAVVADLKAKGLAIESQGATAVFIDGPDKSPLIVEKTGGGYLYGTTDLAAIRYRVTELHANRIIYTHDSRQAQHFDQVFRTAKAAGWADGVKLEYAPFGTMLGEDGKPFKTRSGGTVKLKELLDEAESRAFDVVTEKSGDLPDAQRRDIAKAVGIGGVKYSDLSKERTSDYVFSFDKMLALDGNTAPYLQYAHARVRSIFRKAAERGIAYAGAPAPGISLQSPYELALAKHILRLDETIDLVAQELRPHLLCAYLYELSARFSGFFENCPVIQSDEPVRQSRLALCDLTARTLEVGLDLLGIAHPDQM
jgi:arginyl-tRNA synthetase